MVWYLFAGSLFLLMGVSLVADAEGHASSALKWSTPSAERSAGLVATYRLIGATFLIGGGALAAAVFFFPGKLRAVALDGFSRAAAGLALSALGAALAYSKAALLVKSPLPAVLDGDGLGRSPSLGARVSAFAGSLLIAEILAFGCALLWRKTP